MLKRGLSRQICSEKLLVIAERQKYIPILGFYWRKYKTVGEIYSFCLFVYWTFYLDSSLFKFSFQNFSTSLLPFFLDQWPTLSLRKWITFFFAILSADYIFFQLLNIKILICQTITSICLDMNIISRLYIKVALLRLCPR